MTETRKKIILLVASILLSIGILIGAVAVFQAVLDKKGISDESRAEYERELASLIYEKQELLRKISEIENGIFAKIGRGAYMSFMFFNLDEELYNDVYPILAEGEHPIVGVLAFSGDELPGIYGKISKKQYDELILAGWGTTLYWDGEGELDGFILEMRAALGQLDIAFPTSIAFATNTYTDEYASILAENGIVNIIHNGDLDMKILNEELPGDRWYPGYIGWNNRSKYGGSVRLKESTETSGGYSLFAIKFHQHEDDDLKNTAYYPIGAQASEFKDDVNSFARMVEKFKISMSISNINVTTVEAAREGRTEYFELYDKMATEGANRKVELEGEVREVEKRMSELYTKYFGTGDK